MKKAIVRCQVSPESISFTGACDARGCALQYAQISAAWSLLLRWRNGQGNDSFVLGGAVTRRRSPRRLRAAGRLPTMATTPTPMTRQSARREGTSLVYRWRWVIDAARSDHQAGPRCWTARSVEDAAAKCRSGAQRSATAPACLRKPETAAREAVRTRSYNVTVPTRPPPAPAVKLSGGGDTPSDAAAARQTSGTR
jgi:hypothetical protein